nr:DUF6174 domain-containing protein [Nocardioides houyundeii]
MNRSRRTTTALVATTAVGVATAVLWVAWPDWSAGRAHDEALALWESKEPRSYSFHVSSCSGMCWSCPVRIAVTDGVVTGVNHLGDEQCGQGSADLEKVPTMEDIFARAERGRSEDWVDSYEIEYDPVWGFPASIELKCPYGTPDCGSGIEVYSLRVQSP